MKSAITSDSCYIEESYMLIMYDSRFDTNCLQIPPRSESGGSVGKLKLSSEMKERFEAAVTGGGGGSRRDSMKSSNEEEVGKLGEDRKKILEQKLRAGSRGAGAGESKAEPGVVI